jgi:hypothetical protein
MQRATDEPEHPEDGPGEGRWLSYDELSRLRCISRESAIRLARREKWRRTRGNNGTARVFCPPDWLESSRKNPGGQSPGQSPGQPHDPPEIREDLSRIIEAFEDGLAAFREQVEAERQRAERAEHERDALQADLARAEERLRQAEIERLVAAAAERSSLFGRLWRRRG